MSELRAENLHFGFADGSTLLNGVSLAVKPGEMVVILGENASGKTTLLKVLGGLLRPQSGRVTVNGSLVEQVRDQVGIVFQNPDHQMIAGTVEEEIALGLELRGVAQAEMKARVAEVIGQFQLDELRAASPESLSGGQKQRVALAAVMVSQPAFLLFDEPDSLLDAPSRSELMSAVSIVRYSCGMVWTTPHPRRMPRAEHIFELRDGTLHVRT